MRALDTIEDAIKDLKLGKMIIVVDDEDRDGTEPADNPELSHDTPNSLSMREDYLPRYAPLISIPDSSRGKDLRAALLTGGARDKKYFYSFDQLGNIVRDHEVALSSQSMNKCSLC